MNARDDGLPLPAAAFVMSPMPTSPLANATMESKRAVDALMSLEALRARVPDYTSGHDAALGLISPIFADLSGLPPDHPGRNARGSPRRGVRLARQAAIADVEVTLDITPSAARLPILLGNARRRGRGAGPSRTVPVGASRQRRTGHRLAKAIVNGRSSI